ncbi:LysE family translocator [Streptomyces flavidovirens]|uniref:LysE family translocator n=1 Tax=Streptomyces flavidovirens TaxID=67298 RepID=UPI0004180289|nr:LysE family translocator [Streptomyces flavidovirens]
MDVQLVAFTGVAAGMVAMPGADFTVVVRNALASRRDGVACAAGVAGGLLVHTALAVAGLAAVLVAVPALFRAIQLLGGAYILFLGYRALRSALRPAPPRNVEPEPEGRRAGGTGRSLRQGFLTNALNPKAPVLFLSLLPQFVPADQQPLPRTLLLATIVVVLAMLWFTAVALLVDGLGGWLRRPGAACAVEAVSGSALVVLGVALLAGTVTAAG